jgi:phosphoglycolate phosphatase-like HAD superfamily hydrolase
MKLAVFDIDGTLVQTTRVDDSCFVRAFRDVFGIEDIDTDWSHYESCTDAVIVPEILRRGLGREPKRAEVVQHRERFAELLAESLERDAAAYAATPGAQELLDTLSGDPEWGVALATGGWRVTSHFKLRAGGLNVDGIPVANADDARTREEIAVCAYQQACDQADVDDFCGTVLIGDGVWDLTAARNLGAGFVGIARGEGAGRLRSLGAATVQADFEPVSGFVELLAEA